MRVDVDSVESIAVDANTVTSDNASTNCGIASSVLKKRGEDAKSTPLVVTGDQPAAPPTSKPIATAPIPTAIEFRALGQLEQHVVAAFGRSRGMPGTFKPWLRVARERVVGGRQSAGTSG
jgi:hypothetical protein